MSFVFTTGITTRECDVAGSLLNRAGIALPTPFKDTDFGPADLLRCIIDEHEETGNTERVEPSARWYSVSSDMILRKQKNALLGWAHTDNIKLLDFWKTLEPNAKFILLYSDPEHLFIDATKRGHGNPPHLLGQWLKFMEQVLEFYHTNESQCVLANSEAIHNNPLDFLSVCQKKLAIKLDTVSESSPPFLSDDTDLLSWIARQVSGTTGSVPEIFKELEANTDLPSNSKPVLQGSATRAVMDLVRLHRERQVTLRQCELLKAEMQETAKFACIAENERNEIAEELEKKILSLEGKGIALRSLEAEKNLILRNNHKLKLALEKQEELAADKVRESERLAAKLIQAEKKFDEDAKTIAALYAENELVLLNHEELLKSQMLQEKVAQATANNAIAHLIVDLKKSFSGTGWHDAEPDGRWTGPEVTSTISFPALAPARYEFTMEIVSSMSVENIENLKVSIGDRQIDLQPIPAKHIFSKVFYRYKSLSDIRFPISVKGIFSTSDEIRIANWTLQIECHETLKPGNEDLRKLGLKINSATIKQI